VKNFTEGNLNLFRLRAAAMAIASFFYFSLTIWPAFDKKFLQVFFPSAENYQLEKLSRSTSNNMKSPTLTPSCPAPPYICNKWLRRAQLAAAGLVLTSAGSASALIFDFNYSTDATFTAAGLTAQNITDMKAAMNYAALQFTSAFSDPIHVNVNVTSVAGTGTLGGSSTFLTGLTFAQLQTRLGADATTANDATSVGVGGSFSGADPIAGAHTYFVSRAQAKAIGLTADDAVTADGTFTFGGGFSYSYDPNNRAVAGKYDFIGVAMHELSEIMGRIGLMGQNLNGNPDYMLMDLTHYTGAATRGLSNGAGRFFSFDGGTTLLKGFNNASVNGGDLQDWASGANDTFNAFSGSGVLNALTTVDLQTMDVIGYDRIPVPEPSTVALGALGVALGGLVRRGRAAKK
jgi:hypothetical protein